MRYSFLPPREGNDSDGAVHPNDKYIKSYLLEIVRLVCLAEQRRWAATDKENDESEQKRPQKTDKKSQDQRRFPHVHILKLWICSFQSALLCFPMLNYLFCEDIGYVLLRNH